MAEHLHHWVLIDGFTNAYTCCDCGAARGDKRVMASVRPVHSRRLLGVPGRRLARRTRATGTRGAA